MDITKTTEPRSDQMNYDDFVSGTKTVTVQEVKAGSADQPVEVHLVEFPGRPFKPSKSMRRVLVAAWGSEAEAYKGRRITLYGDPDVKFGGQAVGGIRIAALSHITEPLEVRLTVTRGKRAPFTVQPLPDVAPEVEPHLQALTAATTLDELREAWEAAQSAGVASAPLVVAFKDKRKAELTAETVEADQ